MYCVRAAMSLSRAGRGGKHLRNARQGLLLSRANPAGNLSAGLARMDSTAPVIATAPLDLSAPADAAAAAVSSAVEPTFHSLGLAHAYPSGMLQSVMEAIHVHAGVPWWGTIVITTAALRVLLFPLVVRAQKNMINMNHHLPEMQAYQVKALTATTREERAKVGKEMQDFFKRTGCHPLKNYVPMIGQGFVFCSMFFALRGMANCPVESMKTQGLFWFVDLTASDPFFILPVVTSASVFLHIKIGADGVDTDSVPPFMRNLLLALPLISLPVMCQFPAALNVYWLTTNLISIVQTRIIRQPLLRERLGLGELIKWKPEDLPMGDMNKQFSSAFAAKDTKVKDSKGNSPTEHELNLKVIESRAREELEKESERKRSRNKA